MQKKIDLPQRRQGHTTKSKKETPPPPTTIEQASQEIIRNISMDDLQILKLLVDKELFVQQKAASDLGVVSLPSLLSSKQVGLLTQQSKLQGIEKQVSLISKSLEI